ncbi:unnamed protein product [Polarella glacialis]|uniref:Bestrophin homolog n=1 Tax=Polarella glacialis TaxID=89957 RepID=A0A813H722_POLGL|nr:unnamed protein product [Polarella glacialis]
MDGIEDIWSGYTFVLGFLIVFRNNQAYNRFWEGTSLTKQMKGQWFVSFSGLFAFCSRDKAKKADVARFQTVLVRLASLLHCSALQQICDLEDNSLEIINSDEMDLISMNFLRSFANPQEVVTNWIQRMIVEAVDSGTIDISAPVLSRTFQELGNGLISLNNARKIKDVQFPFPYAQMISCMLFVHWLVTPILAAHQIGNSAWAGAMSFSVTISFWSLFYIALEIDQPFGEDANDLPIHEMQQEWNNSLLTLLLPYSQVIPSFSITSEESGRRISKISSGTKNSRESDEYSEEYDEDPGTPKLFRQHNSNVQAKKSDKDKDKDDFRKMFLGRSSSLGGYVSEFPREASEVDGIAGRRAPMIVTIHGDYGIAQDAEGASVITATSMEMKEDETTGEFSMECTSLQGLMRQISWERERWARSISEGAITPSALAVAGPADALKRFDSAPPKFSPSKDASGSSTHSGSVSDEVQHLSATPKRQEVIVNFASDFSKDRGKKSSGGAGHSTVASEGGISSLPRYLRSFADGGAIGRTSNDNNNDSDNNDSSSSSSQLPQPRKIKTTATQQPTTTATTTATQQPRQQQQQTDAPRGPSRVGRHMSSHLPQLV